MSTRDFAAILLLALVLVGMATVIFSTPDIRGQFCHVGLRGC